MHRSRNRETVASWLNVDTGGEPLLVLRSTRTEKLGPTPARSPWQTRAPPLSGGFELVVCASREMKHVMSHDREHREHCGPHRYGRHRAHSGRSQCGSNSTRRRRTSRTGCPRVPAGTRCSLSTEAEPSGHPVPGPGILADMSPQFIGSALRSRSDGLRIRTTRPARIGQRIRGLIACTLALPLLFGEPALAAAPLESDPDRMALIGASSEHAVGLGMQYPVANPVQVLRPFDAPERDWSAGHRGVDLLLSSGGPVRAPAGGSVTVVGHIVNRGVLVIEHENGMRSSFEPVESDLPVGQQVEAGAVIAHLDDPDGTRSHCAAPCLHWGVRIGDTYVDPLRLVAGEPSVLFPDRVRP